MQEVYRLNQHLSFQHSKLLFSFDVLHPNKRFLSVHAPVWTETKWSIVYFRCIPDQIKLLPKAAFVLKWSDILNDIFCYKSMMNYDTYPFDCLFKRLKFSAAFSSSVLFTICGPTSDYFIWQPKILYK